jgi:hypothetical protein
VLAAVIIILYKILKPSLTRHAAGNGALTRLLICLFLTQFICALSRELPSAYLHKFDILVHQSAVYSLYSTVRCGQSNYLESVLEVNRGRLISDTCVEENSRYEIDRKRGLQKLTS